MGIHLSPGLVTDDIETRFFELDHETTKKRAMPQAAPTGAKHTFQFRLYSQPAE
jgi:hypothetical protein